MEAKDIEVQFETTTFGWRARVVNVHNGECLREDYITAWTFYGCKRKVALWMERFLEPTTDDGCTIKGDDLLRWLDGDNHSRVVP